MLSEEKKSIPLQPLKVLTDEFEVKPFLDFDRYVDTIVRMVKGSEPNFSIGIYGEWGTGKTTLMRAIEKRLKSDVRGQEVTWEGISGNNTVEANRLKNFLIENFKVDWIRDLPLVKKDERTIEVANTRTNDSSTKTFSMISFIQKIGFSSSNPPIQAEGHSLSLRLNEQQMMVTLTIDNKFIRKYNAEKMNGDITLYLQENKILTVWFNAWRYEREEQFALVSLMKTIAYKMDEQPKYEKAKEVFFKSIVTAAKGLASKYVLPEKYVEELHQNLTSSNMKGLAEEDKDTIYFHGLKQIEDAMNKVLEDSPESRVVVFIDDLDRCSPNKGLEVFESIKAFLGIKGFVYIIGLSHNTVGKLITAEYQKSGVTGEDYIKKIIQIPIMVPEWNSYDIANLIEHVIVEKLDERYSKLIRESKELISIVSEANPRELKRFINNFIVSNEIFSINRDIQGPSLLALQALKVRWPNFYRELTSTNSSYNEFHKSVAKCASMKYEDRIRELREMKSRQNDEKNFNREIEKKVLEIDSTLWDVLAQAEKIIFNIHNWEVYRRAAESTRAHQEVCSKGYTTSDTNHAIETTSEIVR